MPINLGPTARVLSASLLFAITVLALSSPAPATEKTLYIFPSDKSKGCYPEGTLLRDAAGALYGTTTGCFTTQNDTVFKLTPPAAGQTQWTATVLHTFNQGLDGRFPQPNLVMDGSGALYGATSEYGAYLQGMVYRLKPPQPGQTKWTETK